MKDPAARIRACTYLALGVFALAKVGVLLSLRSTHLASLHILPYGVFALLAARFRSLKSAIISLTTVVLICGLGLSLFLAVLWWGPSDEVGTAMVIGLPYLELAGGVSLLAIVHLLVRLCQSGPCDREGEDR